MPAATPMASKSSMRESSNREKAHARAASSRGLNFPWASRGAASAASALKSSGAGCFEVAKAHARFESAWASNSLSRESDSAAIASNRAGAE
eukprot:scaffold310180_cov30-Tisochrysis_lutea.AAC.1